LTKALLDLREAGNSIVIIEHNLELVACADWVIDMGPEGGDGGGLLVAEGTPEEVAKAPGSHTGVALREILESLRQAKKRVAETATNAEDDLIKGNVTTTKAKAKAKVAVTKASTKAKVAVAKASTKAKVVVTKASTKAKAAKTTTPATRKKAMAARGSNKATKAAHPKKTTKKKGSR
jgi:excinuclease ABC subunit A